MMKQNRFSLPEILREACLPTGERLRQRAVIFALSRQGVDHQRIALFAAVHPKTVLRWTDRIKQGWDVSDAQRSGRPRRFVEKTRLQVIAVYCQHKPPLPGVYRWSLRDAQAYFKDHQDILGNSISHSTIQRILLEHALKPHRRKYYLQITDPDFFPKMEHIIGCYSLPNLYCFDECTGIQALKRLSPNLPTASNQPQREDFDYCRNGTTSLLAFLHPATGTVYGQCADNHNRHTLSHVFRSHVQMHPPEAVIHYIMDNFSTHYHHDFCQTVAELSGVEYFPLKKGYQRRQWLQSDHKRIVVHFVPFHASWLNMVEIWFGILNGKCLKYEQFVSVKHLCEAILAFIETWNEFYAHPFNWSYTGLGLHGQAVRRFSRLLFLETEQMDAKFLKSQLLLMKNIFTQYRKHIDVSDCQYLQNVAIEKQDYITKIIESDTKPRRQKQLREAYLEFEKFVIEQDFFEYDKAA
jgi:transposase